MTPTRLPSILAAILVDRIAIPFAMYSLSDLVRSHHIPLTAGWYAEKLPIAGAVVLTGLVAAMPFGPVGHRVFGVPLPLHRGRPLGFFNRAMLEMFALTAGIWLVHTEGWFYAVPLMLALGVAPSFTAPLARLALGSRLQRSSVGGVPALAAVAAPPPAPTPAPVASWAPVSTPAATTESGPSVTSLTIRRGLAAIMDTGLLAVSSYFGMMGLGAAITAPMLLGLVQGQATLNSVPEHLSTTLVGAGAVMAAVGGLCAAIMLIQFGLFVVSGSSIGKAIMGLRVRAYDGFGLVRRTLRAMMIVACVLFPFGILFLIIHWLITSLSGKRPFYDRWTSTEVVLAR